MHFLKLKVGFFGTRKSLIVDVAYSFIVFFEDILGNNGLESINDSILIFLGSLSLSSSLEEPQFLLNVEPVRHVDKSQEVVLVVIWIEIVVRR